MKYYVAYGSNLSVDQMAHRCPDATIVGTGVLKDWELVFRYHATIEPRPGCTLPVLVWAISERDEARLDRYEGYPQLYRRETVQVELNCKTVDAMVYIMNSKGIAPPSPFYYDVIRKGYEMNELDTAVLEQARQESLTKR